MYEKYIKRLLDIIFTLIFLFLLWPIMVVCAIAIKIEDPNGPVIFRQDRIGKDNKMFKVLKFRSMRIKRKKNGIKLSDAERMLKVGNILRKSSLDELPQLFNIIRGQMSFIGSRPLPVLYLPYYTEEEIHRHDIKPGISGWAQVNGRNYLSWEKRFEYDLFYVNNVNFLFDLKIFFMTIKKVFLRSNVGIRGVDVPDESLHEIRQTNKDSLLNTSEVGVK